MAVEIGALRAMLSLDSAAFERGAKRAEASMGNMQRRLSRLGRNMRQFGRTMSTRVTAPLALAAGAAVRSSLKTVDAQAKMAESLDTTVVSVQNLTRASNLAGISQGDLDGSLRRMARRISLAEDGTGAAVDAFERLNLSASDLSDLPVDERVEKITSRIREMIPEAEQAGVASKVFGDKTGLAIMRLDGDTLARAADEVQRFGVGVSEVDAQKIEDANDALSAIGSVTRGLSNQLTVALAPTLQSIAEKIADVSQWFSQLSPDMRRFAAISATVAAAVGPLAIGIGFVAMGFAALASPIGLAIFALGAVAGAAIYVATQWDEIKERFPGLADGMERVGNVFKETWEFIETLVVGAKDIVNGALDAIVGLLTGDLKGALEGLKTMWQGWSDIVDGAMQAVLGIIEAIVPGFEQAVDDIIASVSALPEKLKQWGMDAIQGFVDGIKERWAALKESVTSIFSLGNVDANQVGMDIGADLGAGLGLGLESTRSGLEQEARDYLNSIEGAARDETETRSPSRKWMKLGRDLMEGLGIGVQNNTQVATNAIREGVGQMETGLEGLGDKAEKTADRFGSMVAGIITGSRSIGDVLSQLGNNLLSSGISSIASNLFSGSGLADVFAGFFDKGGSIGAGQFGIAGERGPEIVTGPAQVTSRRKTASVLSGGVAGTATIRIVAPPGFTAEQRGEAQGIAVEVMETGLDAFERERLPDQIERFRNDDKVRG